MSNKRKLIKTLKEIKALRTELKALHDKNKDIKNKQIEYRNSETFSIEVYLKTKNENFNILKESIRKTEKTLEYKKLKAKAYQRRLSNNANLLANNELLKHGFNPKKIYYPIN